MDYKEEVVSGIPSRNRSYREGRGFFRRGRQAAIRTLEEGPGKTTVIEFKFDFNDLNAFKQGVRHHDEMKTLRLMQRKQESTGTVKIYLFHREDEERLREDSQRPVLFH